jgi:general secretion pathway protein I
MSVRSTGQAGFTLIEVLVALAILSLAVVASIQGFAQGLRLLKLAGDHQQAMLLADQKVREVVEFKEGRDAGTEGRLRWERSLRSLETPDLAPAGRPPIGRFYEIDVRVSWDPQRLVEIRTMRMVPNETSTATLPAGQGTLPATPGTTPGAGSRPPGTAPSGASPFGRGLLPSSGSPGR